MLQIRDFFEVGMARIELVLEILNSISDCRDVGLNLLRVSSFYLLEMLNMLQGAGVASEDPFLVAKDFNRLF